MELVTESLKSTVLRFLQLKSESDALWVFSLPPRSCRSCPGRWGLRWRTSCGRPCSTKWWRLQERLRRRTAESGRMLKQLEIFQNLFYEFRVQEISRRYKWVLWKNKQKKKDPKLIQKQQNRSIKNILIEIMHLLQATAFMWTFKKEKTNEWSCFKSSHPAPPQHYPLVEITCTLPKQHSWKAACDWNLQGQSGSRIQTTSR